MSKKKPRPIPVPADTIPGLIDAHTHIASCGATEQDEVDAFVQRALAAGVERICTVGDGLAEAEFALQAAQMNSRVFAACAIHPTRARELDQAARNRLTEMAHDPRCVAIGETGIDTYWITHDPDNTADLETQEEALRWHIDLAVATGKALMIHNREGDDHLMRILEDSPQPPETILHCFSSPIDVTKQALDRGYVLSFAGNVTFKRNEELREAARIAPISQLLIETDAPYMTPEPFRGARNESALIGHTALCVAASRGESVADCVAGISATFDRVYGVDTSFGA
ncbi:TatD family hydrolase [Corynebacterium diphtheriae]